MKNPTIPLLLLIAMLSPIAMNAFNPAMPDVVRLFDSTISTVQLTFTLYLFSLGLAQLICGPLADRFGRRPLLLLGLLLHFLGSVVAALAGSVEHIIAGRILQAAGGGMAMVLCRTIVLDLYQREKASKQLAYIVMAVAFSQTIAPTIGGYLNYYLSWRSIFYMALIHTAIIFIAVLRWLPETCKQTKTQLNLTTFFTQYAQVCRTPAYLAYALTGALAASAYFAFASAMPYIVVDQMGGTSATYGNWFLWVSLGFFAGSTLSARLTEALGLDHLIQRGLLLAGLGAVILLASAMSQTLLYAALFIPMSIVTLGRGLIQPNAQSGALSAATGSTGTAAGLIGFIQLMFATLVSQSMPYLLQFGVLAVALFILVCLLGSWLAHRYARVHSVVSN